MKIVYFANIKSDVSTIDQDILVSLKKKGEVTTFDLRDFDEVNMKKIIEKANKSDVFLFHALIPDTNDTMLGLILERIQTLLDSITCKKVLWFIEKVVGNKMKIVTQLLPFVDYMYLNDETWTRRFENERVSPLHVAAPEKHKVGKFRPELSCDIAMVGSLYGGRIQQYEFLKNKFGDSFKFFDDKFGKDYADVCKSAKIVLVPQEPFDDFYWSERIYTTLENGALCLHPRAHGLKEEGFIDGQHYFDYYTEQDLFVTLTMLLDKKSKKVRQIVSKQGKDFVKDHTYSQRLDIILNKIKPNEAQNI